MFLSVEEYETAAGLLFGMKRICKCKPFYKGSYIDYPQEGQRRWQTVPMPSEDTTGAAARG